MSEPSPHSEPSELWWTCPYCNEWTVGVPSPDLREQTCFALMDEGRRHAWRPDPSSQNVPHGEGTS